ncbi:hypothetical protein MKX01_011157 [Papaver californicum]|nr:hypothetical protein MKX01_011157 [Papaver californicum]
MFRCFKESERRSSNALSTVQLLVHMNCEGCERMVKKAISKLEDIDMDNQKVTVMGYVNQRQVLKMVRRTRKKLSFGSPYLEDSTFSSTYSYYRHGYNESVHGYFPNFLFSTIIDDHTAHYFSDENVHACTVTININVR